MIGVAASTPDRLKILATCDRGMVPWRLMRLETRKRVVSLSRFVMELMPMLIPCSMPNKKNAVTMENTRQYRAHFLAPQACPHQREIFH